MKKPDQLQFDFSENRNENYIPQQGKAKVFNLEKIRGRKKITELAAVYEAIHKSIKHIDVSRNIKRPVSSDSK